MRLCDKTIKLMRIVTIFGMHEPLVLAMGVAPASEFFQRSVSNLMMKVTTKPKSPKCCTDGILAAFIQTLGEYVECLDVVFEILKEAGFQINLSKSALCQKALEHVGFWLMPNGHRPLASRVQGTLDIKPLRSKRT